MTHKALKRAVFYIKKLTNVLQCFQIATCFNWAIAWAWAQLPYPPHLFAGEVQKSTITLYGNKVPSPEKITRSSLKDKFSLFTNRFNENDACYLNKSNPYHLVRRTSSDQLTPAVLQARKLLHQQAVHNKVHVSII